MKPSVSQLRRLIGNPEAYALQNEDGTYTPVRKPLTDAVLQHHVEGNRITVGTYILNKDSAARTLVFDIDTGEEQEALDILVALEKLGIPKRCVALEDSGKKGFHVWVPLQEYVPAPELRRVGRAVLALADVVCEVFPKQDELKDLGNLVKLPGGKHQVSGRANDFIGPAPMVLPVTAWQAVMTSLPPEQHARREYVDNRFPCLEHIQEGLGEGGRNNGLFQLATLMRRHGMTDSLVPGFLDQVNARFSPPLDGPELENIADASRTSGPICTPEMKAQCGTACIQERTGKLQERGGEVKHGTDGQCVVVTLDKRAGSSVTLSHEDLLAPLKGRVVVKGREE